MRFSHIRWLAALIYFCSFNVSAAKVILTSPQEVPANLGRCVLTELTRERSQLLGQLKEAQEQIDRQFGNCHEVEEGSPKVDECIAQARQVGAAIKTYRAALERFRSKLATEVEKPNSSCLARSCQVDKVQAEIKGNQDAIRKIGLGTSVEAFEQVQDATKDQLEEYKKEMIDALRDALFSGAMDWAKDVSMNTFGPIGVSEAKHLRKAAEDLGITNPDVLEGITAVGNVKDKREKIKFVMESLKNDTERAVGAAPSIEAQEKLAVQTSNELAFAMVFVTQAAPEYAKKLSKKIPSFAIGAAKKLTIETGLAAAPAIATTIDNLIMLHHPREAIDILDRTTDDQLNAVSKNRSRMVKLVGELRAQRAALESCKN